MLWKHTSRTQHPCQRITFGVYPRLIERAPASFHFREQNQCLCAATLEELVVLHPWQLLAEGEPRGEDIDISLLVRARVGMHHEVRDCEATVETQVPVAEILSSDDDRFFGHRWSSWAVEQPAQQPAPAGSGVEARRDRHSRGRSAAAP